MPCGLQEWTRHEARLKWSGMPLTEWKAALVQQLTMSGIKDIARLTDCSWQLR